ncbi:MAG: hypothetical protein HY076_07410, partial [Candidatus Eisenbacteria bacterium]|nr:hypothetical protein [Candidatus Eisenbacteria bacterium]
SSRSRRGWTVIHRNQSGQPFFVQDDTGVAMVYPHDAACTIAFGVEEQYEGLALPACYADYMNAHASALGQLARVGMLRFRERVLEGGETVFVLGTATPRAQERVIGDGDLMLATGTDGAVVSQRQTLDQETVAVVRRGENESTFIISQESQKSLMMDLGFQSFFQLLGGPALTLFGLAWWLTAWSSGRMPWSR